MAFTFDVFTFRTAYPAFASDSTYPTAVLQAYWDTASCYIDVDNYGALNGACRDKALNLMTAHLAMIAFLTASDQINLAGKTAFIVQSTTIDKVTISLQSAQLKNQWQWWLSLTPYGQQLLALLQVSSAGGFYFSGLPEVSAFRKVGGLF